MKWFATVLGLALCLMLSQRVFAQDADDWTYDGPYGPQNWALLSDDFAKSQFARIDMQKALSQPVASALPHHRDTVYLTVVDEDRNCCSFINSVFHSWGSGLVATARRPPAPAAAARPDAGPRPRGR